MDQAVTPQSELTLDEVLDRKFELDEQVAIIQGKHKVELEPFNEELRMCELFIKDEMNKAGMQQVKNKHGHMAFFTTKDSVTVSDFDQVIAYIMGEKAFHMLNKAVNKSAVKEYIELHKAPPPGVKYDSYRDLAWRRGKG